MNMDYAKIKAVADYVRSIDPDDESLLADSIEGETDAFEVLDKLIAREAELRGFVEANNAHKKALSARTARFNAQADVGRAAMRKLFEAMGVRKVERPEATVSLARVAPKVIEGDVAQLPDDLVRTTRDADKAAVKEALQSGKHFPGWSMSNGGETIKVNPR